MELCGEVVIGDGLVLSGRVMRCIGEEGSCSDLHRKGDEQKRRGSE